MIWRNSLFKMLIICKRRFDDKGVFHQIGGESYKNDHIRVEKMIELIWLSMGRMILRWLEWVKTLFWEERYSKIEVKWRTKSWRKSYVQKHLKIVGVIIQEKVITSYSSWESYKVVKDQVQKKIKCMKILERNSL